MQDRHKTDSIFRPSPKTVMTVISEIKTFHESDDYSDLEKQMVLRSLREDYLQNGSSVGTLIAGIIDMSMGVRPSDSVLDLMNGGETDE